MTLSELDLDDLFTNVGIDSIGFYAPRYYVSLENLATVRDVNPDKYKYGLMTHEMRIPDVGEDSISLGVKAGYNALIRGGINAKEIDALFVGTEATIYSVKSISNIFKDMLGLSQNCLTQDVSNACAASSIAILNAISMLETGIINKALVITVDISSYDLNSPGEPTQGAGSVALVLTRNPRIAVFSKQFGMVSSNINDFYRPEGEKNAQVFGQYSVASYLTLQMEVYENLISKIGNFYSDYYIFHSPYAKLPLKLMQRLLAEKGLDKLKILMRHDQTKPQKLSEINYFNELTKDVLISKCITDKLQTLEGNQEEKKILEDWIYNKIRNTCLPPLQVSALFGNMYSAALWAEFQYLVENFAHAHETIYFGSYGSGATALSGLIKIQPKFRTVLSNSLNMSGFFHDKIQKSVEEYERLRLFSQELQLSWIKINPKTKLSMKLKYCDEGCNISLHPGLDYCPKGHSGSHLINFPMIGEVMDNQKYHPGDLTPLTKGYVFTNEKLKIGDIVEFEIRRWLNKYETHPKHGLLNWMPFYRLAPNTPYLEFAKELAAGVVEDKNVATSTSSLF